MDARNLFLCLTALFASLAAGAQVMPDSTRYSFGRQPVKSSHTSGSPYADTLDTENPAVKVLLFNNGTYRYVRDPKIVADKKVFTEHWDTRSVNPYHDETPLPDRFTLWIVDTLDSYCCPTQTPRPPT